MGGLMAGVLGWLQEQGRKGLERRADAQVYLQSKLAERLWEMQNQQAQAEADRVAPGIARALGALPETRGLRGQTPSVGSGWENLPPELASTMQLLMNPDTRQVGVGMASGLLDPGQRQALKNAQLAGQATQQNIDQAAQAFPLEQERRRLEIANQQLAARKLQQDIALGAAVPVTPYGEPPKGYFPVLNPESGLPEYIPQPGTEAYNAARSGTAALEETVRGLQDFLVDIEGDPQHPSPLGPTGTEWTGPAATAIEFKRGNVISALAQLRNLGVLQPGEYETIEKQLPSPTALLRNLQGLAAYTPLGLVTGGPDYVRSTITAPYREMLEIMQKRLEERRRQYWYVRQEPGLLPEDAGR
jgi:hypothetical protein